MIFSISTTQIRNLLYHSLKFSACYPIPKISAYHICVWLPSSTTHLKNHLWEQFKILLVTEVQNRALESHIGSSNAFAPKLHSHFSSDLTLVVVDSQ